MMTRADVGALRIGGEPVPSLADVIRAIGDRLRIYCELKGTGTAAAAVAMLTPLGDRAAVHSFDHRMVAEARALAPQVARGVLETSYHLQPGDSLWTVSGRDLWQHAGLIDRALVNAVHAAGGRVIAWTVNEPDRAVALAALGVDGICTDDVAGIGAVLRQRAASSA